MKLLLLASFAALVATSVDAKNLNRISCQWDSRNTRNNIVRRCDNRKDGKHWPYSCDDGRQVCCTESYINEPDMKDFGTCVRVQGGPPAPSRHTRKPTNRRPDAPAHNSIQCTAPQQRRIRSEGHRSVCESLPGNEVPYSCDTGTQLCCNKSNMDKATFKKFGTCRKTHFSNGPGEEDMNIDELENEDEVKANLLDLGAHIQCNFGGERPCPRGRSPYTCMSSKNKEGEEACCAISSNNKKRNRKAIREMMREVNVPGHGMCVREDSSSSSEDCVKDGEEVSMDMYKGEGKKTGEQTDSADLGKQCCSGYATDDTATTGTGIDENGEQWYDGTYTGTCYTPEPDSDCIKDGENVIVESQTINGKAVGKEVDESDLSWQCCSGFAKDEGIASSMRTDENGDTVVTRSYHGICMADRKSVV